MRLPVSLSKGVTIKRAMRDKRPQVPGLVLNSLAVSWAMQNPYMTATKLVVNFETTDRAGPRAEALTNSFQAVTGMILMTSANDPIKIMGIAITNPFEMPWRIRLFWIAAISLMRISM